MSSPIPTEPVTPPVEPPAPPAAPPAPVPTPPPAAPPAVEPAPAEEPTTFDLPYVQQLRREAADRRTAAKTAEDAAAIARAEADAHAAKLTEQQAQLDAIMKAMGIGGEEPPDPAKLAEQLAAAEAQREADITALTATHAQQIRQLTVQATLPAVLSRAGAVPDLTTAVLTADGTLAALDPTSPTYTADLESAVAKALESHPQLKAAQGAVRSGPEIPGRSGGSDQLTLEQVKAMTADAIDAARKAGRLKSLGIG